MNTGGDLMCGGRETKECVERDVGGECVSQRSNASLERMVCCWCVGGEGRGGSGK